MSVEYEATSTFKAINTLYLVFLICPKTLKQPEQSVKMQVVIFTEVNLWGYSYLVVGQPVGALGSYCIPLTVK